MPLPAPQDDVNSTPPAPRQSDPGLPLPKAPIRSRPTEDATGTAPSSTAGFGGSPVHRIPLSESSVRLPSNPPCAPLCPSPVCTSLPEEEETTAGSVQGLRLPCHPPAGSALSLPTALVARWPLLCWASQQHLLRVPPSLILRSSWEVTAPARPT